MAGSAEFEINRVLAKVIGAVVGHVDLNSVLEQAVNTSQQILHAEVCSIFLEDERDGRKVLRMMAASGFATRLVGIAEYRIGEGFTGTIAASGAKFNITDREQLQQLVVQGRPVWKGKFDNAQWPSGRSEFRNCIALPLKIKDHILGVMKVENKLPEYGPPFSEDDESYLETIANVIALAIENARLYDQTERQLKTIASKAAHRINNQVTNYDGLELDLDDQTHLPTPDKSKLIEITKRLRETTRTLKRMVGEFKNYGRPLVIVKRLSDVNQIIADEVSLAKPPASILIKTSLEPTLPPTLLDHGRFAEAVKELMTNSIRAIGNRPGRISISTSLHSATPTGKSIVVELRDTGPGFPKGFPVFEPFQSTDPQTTGLGLATVKELIEAHGGEIIACNNESGGAMISLTIPVYETPAS